MTGNEFDLEDDSLDWIGGGRGDIGSGNSTMGGGRENETRLGL
jgi:hypothetical protein